MPDKAVFLDRDKTIILPNGDNYIYRIGDFYIPDSYMTALKKLFDNEYKLFVVTNQGRVAKGYMTEEDVTELHEYLNDIYKGHGFQIEEFAYCPHNPMGHVSPYNVVCRCRKPKQGMFYDLIDRYDIDVTKSWMVGDTERDIIAGNLCGLKTILLRTGYHLGPENADYIEDDLASAANRILITKN